MAELEDYDEEGGGEQEQQEEGKSASEEIAGGGVILLEEDENSEPAPLCFKRYKVAFSNSFKSGADSIELREFEGIDVDSAAIVEGFPSKGVASIMAANFLVEELKLPLVGDVISDAFPPLCRVSRSVPMPGIRIYGDKRLVVILSEFQMEMNVTHALTTAIYDFAFRHHSSHIFTSEGVEMELDEKDLKLGEEKVSDEQLLTRIRKAAHATEPKKGKENEEKPKEKSPKASPSKKKQKGGKQPAEEEPVPEKDTKLLFVTNDQAFGELMVAHGHRPVKEAIIGGITGAVLSRAATSEITVACLLSWYNPMLSDARASIAVVKMIDTLLGGKLAINVGPLEKRASKVEEKITKVINNLTGAAAGAQSPKSLARSSMYM